MAYLNPQKVPPSSPVLQLLRFLRQQRLHPPEMYRTWLSEGENLGKWWSTVEFAIPKMQFQIGKIGKTTMVLWLTARFWRFQIVFFRNQTAAAKTPLLVFLMGTFDHAMARILRWQHPQSIRSHAVSDLNPNLLLRPKEPPKKIIPLTNWVTKKSTPMFSPNSKHTNLFNPPGSTRYVKFFRPISAPQLERNGGRKRCLPGKGLLPWMMLAPQDPTSHRASKTWKNLEKCWRIGRIGRIGRWKHLEKLEGGKNVSISLAPCNFCIEHCASLKVPPLQVVPSLQCPESGRTNLPADIAVTGGERIVNSTKKWKVLYRKLQECEQNKKSASLSFLC